MAGARAELNEVTIMINKILTDGRMVDDILNDVVEPILGDTPVSVQLNAALVKMASKEDVNALRSDLDVLRKEIEKLAELVGDVSVSEQINTAFKI